MNALDQAISAAARILPGGIIAQLAKTVESLPGAEISTRAILESSVSGPNARFHAQEIASLWQANPELPGSSLAMALRVAALTASQERSYQTIEVAWTGPETLAVPVRRTETILLDLIKMCRQQLIVVSFAAYDVDEVIEELMNAVNRGVTIWLLLEGNEESRGVLRFDAKQVFDSLRGKVSFYAWPDVQRGPPGGPRGTLHAKSVIADSSRALVTSANLTGYALEQNMELGLLVEGGPIPMRLAEHFTELISQKILVEIDY